MTQPTAAGPVRDINWIKQALQSAIELECSTLPLYFSAIFSLKVQNYTIYNQIRSVAMEEMVHMANAGNLLAAIGGTPQVKSIDIKYPAQGLPGGTEPDLHVGLTRFCREQVRNFMRIETPAILLSEKYLNEAYPTISVFYQTIRDAINENAETVRAAIEAGGSSNQIRDNIGVQQVFFVQGDDPVKSMLASIDEILEQGEGASTQSLVTSGKYGLEISHYARFAEMFYGRAYDEPKPPAPLNLETEPLFFKGLPIGWPDVINVLAVPSDGYAAILALDPNAPAVLKDLVAFDSAYTSVLAALDLAWNGPAADSWPNVGLSVRGIGGNPKGMIDFRVLARENVTRHQIPANVASQLNTLYPSEFKFLKTYTDLDQPIFYGPRFINTSIARPMPPPVVASVVNAPVASTNP